MMMIHFKDTDKKFCTFRDINKHLSVLILWQIIINININILVKENHHFSLLVREKKKQHFFLFKEIKISVGIKFVDSYNYKNKMNFSHLY